MKVLLCGHRSFAAVGLAGALRRAGHEVVSFGRGKIGVTREDIADTAGMPAVTGPVDAMQDNSELLRLGPFDTVINYILLKDDGIEKNVAFVASLLRFCREQAGRPVPHLIHISSISSYKASVELVDEAAEIESVPERKGSYGSLKVATDLYLLQHAPPEMKLSLVRPGFILGKGLINPIVGTAARLPWNKLLVIGNGKSVIPMTTRERVNEAVVKIVSSPAEENREAIVLADPDSPTRVRFLETCCQNLGIASGVTTFPVPLWWMLAAGGEVFARLIGQGKLQPYSKLTARLARQRFDSSRTSRRLGMSLAVDWKTVLRESLDGQEQNYRLPPAPNAGPSIAGARGVSFMGFGRIVKQKYLPALKKFGFSGEIRAFDLVPAEPGPKTNGVRVERVADAVLPDSDLCIVASPGPAHVSAIPVLSRANGAVLVEKPLCYDQQDLDAWIAFAAGRSKPVYVCHNYRFKQNVRRMLDHLARFNPGQLHHASLEFFSPPVSNDSAPWLRDERGARTLLMDYAMHFMDIACLFGPSGAVPSDTDAWSVDSVRHQQNPAGQTSVIEGRMRANYSIHFLLRQGFSPRRARIQFTFQNYTVALGFFPDTFVACMADDNPWLFKAEAADSRRQTLKKIVDRLSGRDSDDSHARVLSAATAGSVDVEGIGVRRLAPFYRALFQIADRVYSPASPKEDGHAI